MYSTFACVYIRLISSQEGQEADRKAKLVTRFVASHVHRAYFVNVRNVSILKDKDVWANLRSWFCILKS